MSAETLYIDRRTGEVVPQEVVEAVARDFRGAEEAHAAALAETRRIGAERDRLAEDLRAILPAEAAVDIGTAVIVMEPAARPPQRVSREGAERHREVLLTLGLGRESLDYHAPTATEVRADKARLIAAGVPLADILPEPIPGPPTPKIVAKR